MLDQIKPILGELAGYGELIASVLVVMLGGIVAILFVYKLASSLINPKGGYARAMKVAFGTFYVMVLTVTILVAAAKIGLPVEGLAGPLILIVIVLAVVVFFLLPFLPRLPFVVGDMVEIKDVMGTVEAMTAYQVVVRTFDGQTVFIPTALAMTASIRNYSLIPSRRIQLDVNIYSQNNIEAVRALLLATMNANEKVLADPAPSVFVTGLTGEQASLVAYCWVENADWFGTRDALWVAVANTFVAEEHLHLALPQIDITRAG
jgi:small conductance mechanosensitive channel